MWIRKSKPNFSFLLIGKKAYQKIGTFTNRGSRINIPGPDFIAVKSRVPQSASDARVRVWGGRGHGKDSSYGNHSGVWGLTALRFFSTSGFEVALRWRQGRSPSQFAASISAIFQTMKNWGVKNVPKVVLRASLRFFGFFFIRIREISWLLS